MTTIFAALGVGVSVGIIAAGGGFSGGRPFPNPPTARDIWVVGANIKDGMTLDYSLTAVAGASSLNSTHVSMTFGRSGSDWDVQFTVVNGTTQPVEKTVMMSKELPYNRQFLLSVTWSTEKVPSTLS